MNGISPSPALPSTGLWTVPKWIPMIKIQYRVRYGWHITGRNLGFLVYCLGLGGWWRWHRRWDMMKSRWHTWGLWWRWVWSSTVYQAFVKYSPPGNGSQVMGLIKYQFIMMKMGLIKCSPRQVIGRRGNWGIEDPFLHCPSLSPPTSNHQDCNTQQ